MREEKLGISLQGMSERRHSYGLAWLPRMMEDRGERNLGNDRRRKEEQRPPHRSA
jgi:hypothetical protein